MNNLLKAICTAIPMAIRMVAAGVFGWPGRSVRNVAEQMQGICSYGRGHAWNRPTFWARHTLPALCHLTKLQKGLFPRCREN